MRSRTDSRLRARRRRVVSLMTAGARRVAAAAARPAQERRTADGGEARTKPRSRVRSRPSRPIRTSQPNARSRRSAGRSRASAQAVRHCPHGSPGLRGLFRWLEQSARLLVWGAAVALAALLAVYIVRTVRGTRLPRGEEAFVAPTHVRDLDIRPESLPDGHRHRGARCCGIAASTGRRWRCSIAECCPGSPTFTAFPFAIRAPKATALRWRRAISRREDASAPARLVPVWQRVVYGGQDTQAATVYVPVR